MSDSVVIFSLSSVSFESIEAIMDAIAPVVKEKDITPMSMRIITKHFSGVFLGEMSPYPTVTIVVTVK